jgi:hypothetical protein
MTKKAIYKPTNQKTVILQEFDEYCEILLDGEYKSVLKTELLFEDSASAIATLNALVNGGVKIGSMKAAYKIEFKGQSMREILAKA